MAKPQKQTIPPITAGDVAFVANARAKVRALNAQGRPIPLDLQYTMEQIGERLQRYPDQTAVRLFRHQVDKAQSRIELEAIQAPERARQAREQAYKDSLAAKIAEGLPGAQGPMDAETLHKVTAAALVKPLSAKDAEDPKKVEAHRKARTVTLPKRGSVTRELLSDYDQNIVDGVLKRQETRAKDHAKANGVDYDPDEPETFEVTDDVHRRLTIAGAWAQQAQEDVDEGRVTHDPAPNDIPRETRIEAAEEAVKYEKDLQEQGLPINGRVPLRQAVIDAMDKYSE